MGAISPRHTFIQNVLMPLSNKLHKEAAAVQRHAHDGFAGFVHAHHACMRERLSGPGLGAIFPKADVPNRAVLNMSALKQRPSVALDAQHKPVAPHQLHFREKNKKVYFWLRLSSQIFGCDSPKKMEDDELLAVLMAIHPRLGADSLLCEDVMWLIASKYHAKVS